MVEVLGVVALLYFGGAPLAVYRCSRAAMHPTIVAFDPADVPADVLIYLDDAVAALEGEGFTPAGFFHMPDAFPQLDAFVGLLVHPERGDAALTSAILVRGADSGAPTRQTLFTEFATRMNSGRVFETVNAESPSAFRPLPHESKLQTPHQRDPARLYRIHRWHVERLGQLRHDEAPEMPTVDDPEAFLRAALTNDYEQQVSTGMFWRDEAAGVYRPTLRGAYDMAWRVLWPASMLRRDALEREGRALEARILTEG